MESNKEVKEGYASTLRDLTFNSKPLINLLTMLADENSAHAGDIVGVIESYLQKVRLEGKLPVLYLIDCIMKNVGQPYTSLFCQNLVSTFCTVFELVDERTRAEMFKLRQTWNEIISPKKLYALDVQIHGLDPAWPVTAPAPTSSIYFNPKFLKNSGTTDVKKDVIKPTLRPTLLPNQAALDPVTLDMQKKLIQKQQELIELQQKKVELELLQTRVKLQEQLKSQPLSQLPEGTNIHLKPEVAKQLNVPVTAANNAILPKKLSTTVPSTVKSKLQNSTSTTRINPVSSGLASARPIRDPRLLRHQTPSNTNNINSNIENKNNIPQSIDNKDVNKLSVRDSRVEPRLANNKDIPLPSQGKAKGLPRIPKLSKPTDTYKPTKSSSSSSSRSSKNDGESTKSSSSSNFGSPSKKSQEKSSDSKNRSPSKPPSSKHKKKDSPSKSEKKTEKSSNKSSKSDKDSRSQKTEQSSTTFKDVKGQMKNRNYIRRNRAISISPEPTHDVDLRLSGPPEKVPRLQGELNDKCTNDSTPTTQGMDVDLRKLPELIGKKRISIDAIESTPPKKSKNELMDELFGDEDTDLRVIPPALSPTKAIEKPVTPPPPIISDKINMVPDTNKENKKDSPKGKANFDLVRQKLANATNRDKLLDNEKQQNLHEDIDLRNAMPFSNTEENRINNKIFISPADEHVIKSGNMTKDQETALVTKIMAQLENHKLMEAKRKDRGENEGTRRDADHIGNVSLQPISDEELDEAMSEPEDEFRGSGDHAPPPPNINQTEFGKYSHGRRTEHLRATWRGRRGRHPAGLLAPRPTIRGSLRPEPWIRPPLTNQNQPWRPMVPPPFLKQSLPENYPATDIDHIELGSNSPINQDNNSQDQPNLIVSSANKDNIKSINIDGIPRDIRYYDETAVAFMNWDDPREISFYNGTRRVIFDDNDSYVFNFNEPYRDVLINGHPHRVRLGGPTREIYIDGNPYECYFGGPGISVDLDGRIITLKMEGPPPQVRIGNPRTDLVGGKINLIIDAKNVIPIFLDGKLQKFEVDGKTHTLQFTDALRTALINDTPFKVEFGGLPKPIFLDDNKHFVRFSVLPKGIKPGYVNIKDMIGSRISSPVDENSQDGLVDTNEPALPIFKKRKVPIGAASPDHNSNPSFPFQNLLQSNLTHLDVLSSVMASSLTPTNNASGTSGYSVGSSQLLDTNSQDAVMLPAIQPTPAVSASTFNINDLFQKLVANGIVTTTSQDKPAVPATSTKGTFNNNNNKNNVVKVLKPMYFDKPEALKVRQPALIQVLHSGMQCSSCGMRFPPEHSKHYSQHLDWHFRQNRKGKKNIRKAASRRWFYNLSDWKNYEEVEDVDDKEKNYFDQQQAQGEGANNEEEEEIEIPSVVADRTVIDPRCDVCQDKFEQFYNEEKEEWHLRMAIRVDNKTYHPLCYDDFIASLEAQDSGDENCIPGLDGDIADANSNEESEPVPEEIVIDDDEEETSLNKEQGETMEVTETTSEEKEEPKSGEVAEAIDEAEKTEPTDEVAQEEQQQQEEEDDDDDVIIHEVVPERIILDDDDYNDEEELLQNGDTNDSKKLNVLKEEPIDDGFMDVGDDGILKLDAIRIKSEPIDRDESFLEMSVDDETQEEEEPDPKVSTDTTHADVVPLIDGNVQFESGVMPQSSGISGRIKINITKPIPVLTSRDNSNKELASSEIDNSTNSPELIDPSQPLPPGEENIQLNLKPALQGLKVKKAPPVQKGHELTGLCSIM